LRHNLEDRKVVDQKRNEETELDRLREAARIPRFGS
jgi:hypothetical protein